MVAPLSETASPLLFAAVAIALLFSGSSQGAAKDSQLLQLCHDLGEHRAATTCRSTARELCPISGALTASNELAAAAGRFSFSTDGKEASNGACTAREMITVTPAALALSTQFSDWTRAAPNAAETSGSAPGQLRACVDTRARASASALELESWAEGEESERCRTLVTAAFAEIRSRVREATDRTARNELLRSVADDWGEPSTVAALLLLFGCDASHSFDELTQCALDPLNDQSAIGSTLRLDVNLYARALRLDGAEWKCTTCTFHRHTHWFPSHTVAGTVLHTIAHPTCPSAAERHATGGSAPEAEPEASAPHAPLAAVTVPTFAELDVNLSHAVFPSKPSPIDVPGTRWRLLPGRQAVWETTEVVPVPSGHTVLLSPSWYHRVVPPPAGATHAAMTLRVEYMADSKFPVQAALLDDPAVGTKRSAYAVCFTRWDLIRALLQLELHGDSLEARMEARRRGLRLDMLACSIKPVRLSSLANPAVLATPPFSTPPFLRPKKPRVAAPPSSWF